MTKLLTSVTSQAEELAEANIPYAQYSCIDLDGIYVLSGPDILDEYWEYFSMQMIKHGGLSPLITNKECITNWYIVNWAQYN